IAERGADSFSQWAYQAGLPDEKCARTGALGEAGKVVESDDDQRDDRGEQLDRDECAQRRAIDLGEPGGDCGGQPLLAGFRQPPVALLEPSMDVVPFPACAHRLANSSNIPHTTSHPDVVVPLWCGDGSTQENPPGNLRM